MVMLSNFLHLCLYHGVKFKPFSVGVDLVSLKELPKQDILLRLAPFDSDPAFLKLLLEVINFAPNLQMLVTYCICPLFDIYKQSSCNDKNNSINPGKNKFFRQEINK